jgi:hypothetical protein
MVAAYLFRSANREPGRRESAVCTKGGFLSAYPRPYGRTLPGCGVIIASCLIEISGQAEFLPHSRFF